MSTEQQAMMPLRRWKMTIASLLVFFLLGPVMVRLVWRLSFYALGEAPDLTEYPPHDLVDVISALLGDLPLMYLILGPAFLVVGGVPTLYGVWKGKAPVWLAACPVVVFFCGILLYDLVVPPPPDVTPQLMIVPAFSAVMAAICCGLIARRFWQMGKLG